MIRKLFAFLVIVAVNVHCAKVPDYIQKCSLSEEIIRDCMMKQSKKVIAEMINGSKELNVPNFNPFYVPELHFPTTQHLTIVFLDINIYGFDEIEIEDLWINTKTMKGYLKAKTPVGKILGVYHINGTVLMVPLNGRGPLNLTLINPEIEYKFDVHRVLRKGKEYGNILNSKLDITGDNLLVHLGNLFNGNEFLESNMNKFLNDNWREILPDVYDSLTTTIAKFVERTFAGVFNSLPIDELFLP